MPELITVGDSAGSRRAIPLSSRSIAPRFVGLPSSFNLYQNVAGEKNVYSFTFVAWSPHAEDEVFRAIRLRRPLERSAALQVLAGQAWASIQANRDVDVDAWARQIADDVADAKD